jgi:hypothetical protein
MEEIDRRMIGRTAPAHGTRDSKSNHLKTSVKRDSNLEPLE